MSLDSKHNRMNEFNKLFTSFKNIETKKPETQLKKKQITKNVDELYKKYYDAYKSDYDTVDDINEAKKKKFNYKQFELVDKTDKEIIFFKEIENREKGSNKNGFME